MQETCRWPVKSRAVEMGILSRCAWEQPPILPSQCLWSDAHTEDVQEDRSMSLLFQSEDVLGKISDTWESRSAAKSLHLIPLAGALKPAVVFVERAKPPDELSKLPNTRKNRTASLLGDGVTMTPSGNQICTNHWWEAPNQEVILRGQTLWRAPDAHSIQPQIQQSVS